MVLRRYCPIEVFADVQTDLLARLVEAKRELDVPRLSLAFFDEQGHFDYSRVLHTDPSLKFLPSTVNDGLLGMTIRRGEIIIYPHSIDAKESFLAADARTTFEIAGPVLYNSHACAALFSDLFKGEESRQPNDVEPFRAEFRSVLDSLSDIIEYGRKRLIREEIRSRMEELRTATGAIRGYVAIKDWDGTLDHIKVGDDTSIFLELSETEGLCGYVLQTGKPIYIKDTRTKKRLIRGTEPARRYISSDPNIRSEIVYPFESPSGRAMTSIGVLNLESEHADNFGRQRRELIRAKIEEFSGLIQGYRSSLDETRKNSEFLIGRLNHELSISSYQGDYTDASLEPIEYSAQLAKSELTEIVQGANIFGPFFVGQSLEEAGFGWLSWDERSTRGPTKDGNSWFLPCEIRLEGSFEAVLIVQQTRTFTISMIANVRRVAQLATARTRSLRNASSQKGATELLDTIVFSEDVKEALRLLPKLVRKQFSCDHVTLFQAVYLPSGKAKLFPISSTAESLDYEGVERSYLVDKRDGLTGYSSTRRHPTVIPRFRNNKDLEHLGKFPRCKAKIVETRSDLPQSFAGIPFFKGERVRYLLRLSKILRNHVIGFDEDDIRALNRIQRLTELRLEEVEL